MGLVPQKQTSMKKILTSLILFAALAVMPASAQIKFGVKGGMNNTSLKLDYENAFSNKAGYGWFIGPTVKASFPLGVINLGADAAVLYDERNSKTSVSEIEETIKLKSVIIPINVRMNFSLLKVLGAYVATGPQFGFNVGDDEFKWNKDGVENTFQLKKSYLSINLGAGIFFSKHFEVGFVYNIGVSNTGEASWSEARHAISDDTKAKGWSVMGALYF